MGLQHTEATKSGVFANHIGGRAAESREGREFVSYNPTTGAEWGRFADSSANDVDLAVRSAHAAYQDGPWADMTPTRRGRLMMRWGETILANAERIGRMETEQNGKLLSEMQAQAAMAIDWLYYFGGLADKVEGSVIPLDRKGMLNYTLHEPIGVVGVIVPWNSPTLVMMMALSPALAAGNSIVIKPSEIASASAIELARLAEAAGIPEGVINVVTGGRATGEALVNHPLVASINFTGGDAGGRAVAMGAGKRLARCVLELGGKSPNIVFEDAELDRAESGILSGIFAAAGQTCVAGSRAYIHESVYDKLVGRLVARTRGIVVGDPLKPATQMGPVASKAQLAKDEAMVQTAVNEGAEVLCGGKRIVHQEFPEGFFFEPTIVHKAGPRNHLIQNEVFGPVLTVTPFRDDDEVTRLANDTPFGLAAGLWTTDFRRAHTMAQRLKAGTVWLNTYRTLTFNSPFGGFKESGLGHQNGIQAIQQYLRTKSVWCDLTDQVYDPFVLKR